MMQKKNTLTLILGLLTSLLILSTATYAQKPIGKSIDRIVAIVNDEAITQSDLDAHFEFRKRLKSLTHAITLNNKANFLQSMINDTLIKQKAKALHISITKKDFQKVISNLVKRNQQTQASFQETIEKAGIHYSDYQDYLKQQLLTRELLKQEVYPYIQLSAKEINQFKIHWINKASKQMTRYHVWDYQLGHLAKTPDQAKDIAKKLRKNNNTIAVSLAETRVDLGKKMLSELPSLFQKTVSNMSVKSISNPIQAPNGFHILELASKEKGQAKLSDAKARSLLYRQTLDKKKQAWLATLRQEAYVYLPQ